MWVIGSQYPTTRSSTSRPSPGALAHTIRARRAARANSHPRIEGPASAENVTVPRSGTIAVRWPVNAHEASASRFGPRTSPSPRARSASACTHAATSSSASASSHASGGGARASVSISTNDSTISSSSVPSRSKNSWFPSLGRYSSSTRAGVAGTSECTRRSTRVAALSHRPDAKSPSSDHAGPVIRSSTVPSVVTRRTRPGASASSTGPASRFGSMTSAAPTRPGGAFAIAAHTGKMAEALLPEPVSPSTRVWRVSSARGTTPWG